LEYAKSNFDLDAIQEDGSTKRQHLISAERQLGETPEELLNAPELPEYLVYLWNYFMELSRARGNNGFGPSPLAYSEIQAWARLTKQALDAWELDAILKLDVLFLNAKSKAIKEASSD
jgi:hypothetical protein